MNFRIGPYVCAEWNYGGYPAYLNNIPDMQTREVRGWSGDAAAHAARRWQRCSIPCSSPQTYTLRQRVPISGGRRSSLITSRLASLLFCCWCVQANLPWEQEAGGFFLRIVDQVRDHAYVILDRWAAGKCKRVAVLGLHA